jgi:hypothetical protein
MTVIHIQPPESCRQLEWLASCLEPPARSMGLAHEPRRHGVQPACVVSPGRSGGPGGVIDPPRLLDRDDRRANEGRPYGCSGSTRREAIRAAAFVPDPVLPTTGRLSALIDVCAGVRRPGATEAEKNTSVKQGNALPTVGYRSLPVPVRYRDEVVCKGAVHSGCGRRGRS